MKYRIIWSERAHRQLKRLDRHVAKRLYEAVSTLGEEPHRKVRRLVNSPYYRLRVGDYRVILDIKDGAFRILVLKVGHRSKAYRQ